jgi:hypothetical protein
VDPDLRSFLWTSLVMLAGGSALAIALRSLWWIVAAFFLSALVGLISLTRTRS